MTALTMPKKTVALPPASLPASSDTEEELPSCDVDAIVGTSEKQVTSKRRIKNRRPVISDTVPAIPMASFARLVREISGDIRSDLRWESKAIEALQVDAEAYLIERLDAANKKRKFSHQKTLCVNHLRD